MLQDKRRVAKVRTYLCVLQEVKKYFYEKNNLVEWDQNITFHQVLLKSKEELEIWLDDLQDYIVDSKEQLFSKIEELHHKNDNFWENLKPHIRNKFLNGKVCDQKLYINNISTMFDNLFSNAKNKYN